jgi:type VI secretion system protein VasJ
METPKQAQTLVRKAALFLIEQEPQKAMGYRLLRSVRWDLLEKAPPATDRTTQMPAPQQQQREFFRGLLAAQDWQKALFGAQKAFASGGNHCWLDLQRISASCCEELGDEWIQVREAIENETALLVERVPEIAELRFADGSPFCDEATRDWLEAVRAARGGGPAQTQGAAVEDPVTEERKAANALVASGKTDQALAMVQQGVSSSVNERDRFRRGLMLCGLLLSAGRIDMAMGILDTLEERIAGHRLDSWDPDLAVEAWRMTYEACGKAAGNGEGQAKAAMRGRQQELLRKISCIDPKTAFSLGT